MQRMAGGRFFLSSFCPLAATADFGRSSGTNRAIVSQSQGGSRTSQRRLAHGKTGMEDFEKTRAILEEEG